MKTLFRIRPLVTLTLLLALAAFPARAGNYCNNPVPPCDPKDPSSDCYKPPDPPPKCEPKVCDKCTKSPCYTGSGVYVSDAVDLKIATTGFPIEVMRHYQTTRAIDGESGYGWTSSLSTRLYDAVYLKSAPSTYSREVDIRMPDGALYRFVENGDGSFTPPEGRFDVLVRNGDNTFDLWLQRSNSRMHFAANGNLLSIVDDFGNTQTWSYVNDRLSRIEDTSGSGRFIDITYGADGRVSDVTDSTGRNVHYTYDANGMMTAARNPAAQSTNYTYVPGKYVRLLSGIADHWGRTVTTVTYDAQDRTKTYTERGETYTYTYAHNGVAATTAKTDSGGNLWQYPFAAGGLVTNSVPPGGGPTSHTDYYANGLVQTHTDALGVRWHYTYDSRGNPLTITHDHQGPTAVEWRYTYDAIFSSKNTSRIAYTPGTNDPHPHWQGVKYDYYPPGSTAPGALHHVYELDDDGVTARLVRTFTYDAQGRVLTDTDANGAVTSFTYDSAGNRTSEEHPANNDAGTLPETTFTYDSLGRMLTATDPDGRVTAFTWDVLDRLASRAEPSPAGLTFVTTFHYDEFDSVSQLLFRRVVDPNGAITKAGLDAYGQTVDEVDAAGNATRFTWTKGLLTAKTDPNVYATTYTYDALRRLFTVTYPDATWERYTYLVDNNIHTFRDRLGGIKTYTYDRHKRPIGTAYSGGGNVTLTYTGEKLTAVNDTFASPGETHTFTWDASFRRTSHTQGTRGTVQWTYSPAGRLSTETMSGGATKTYGYYPDGSTRTIEWSPVAGEFRYHYTLGSLVSSITFPNDQTRTFTYDGRGRMTEVANVHPSTGNVATFGVGYDLNAFTGLADRLGMRTSVQASVPALSLSNALTKLDYDVRGQLVRADYPAAAPYSGLTSVWTYDAARNRTSATDNGATASYAYLKYGANPLNGSALQSDGSNAYTYDANGNTLTRTGTRGNLTFTWDADDRLTSIAGTDAATYRYDFMGNRVTSIVNGSTTHYVTSRKHVIAETGAATAQYLYGIAIDEPLAMVRGGAIYYYSVDALGSVIALNDTAGTVHNSYAYDAFGVPKAQNETVANLLGFTGREDAAGGLGSFRYRYYEPDTGSFRSVDPLVSIDGRAMAMRKRAGSAARGDYRYAANSPLAFTDPFGLDDKCAICFKMYNLGMEKCARDYNRDIRWCALTLALCVASPPVCALAYTLCVSRVAETYADCKWFEGEKLKICLEGCGVCPIEPPPPPPPPPIYNYNGPANWR